MEEFVNPGLMYELRLKKEKLARRPNHKMEKEIILQDIRSIGDVYSFWIENPELRQSLLIKNKSSKTIRKEARKGIEAVHNGWYFLNQIPKGKDFIDRLDLGLLKKLNKIVLPNGHEGKMRNEVRGGILREGYKVSLNYLGYHEPKPDEVPEEIDRALSRIKWIYNSGDSITSAITAHLEIAAVQPFPDGNKRVARLIQDRILFEDGFPPAIISAGEGKYYREILRRTLPAYSKGDVKGQREFYDYSASKINNSLDDLLGDLQEESKRILNKCFRDSIMKFA